MERATSDGKVLALIAGACQVVALLGGPMEAQHSLTSSGYQNTQTAGGQVFGWLHALVICP